MVIAVYLHMVNEHVYREKGFWLVLVVGASSGVLAAWEDCLCTAFKWKCLRFR
jgi:hypothetical protein